MGWEKKMRRRLVPRSRTVSHPGLLETWLEALDASAEMVKREKEKGNLGQYLFDLYFRNEYYKIYDMIVGIAGGLRKREEIEAVRAKIENLIERVNRFGTI